MNREMKKKQQHTYPNWNINLKIQQQTCTNWMKMTEHFIDNSLLVFCSISISWNVIFHTYSCTTFVDHLHCSIENKNPMNVTNYYWSNSRSHFDMYALITVFRSFCPFPNFFSFPRSFIILKCSSSQLPVVWWSTCV